MRLLGDRFAGTWLFGVGLFYIHCITRDDGKKVSCIVYLDFVSLYRFRVDLFTIG